MENAVLTENVKPLISEEISKRITSLRFLLIVFVVFIHANLQPQKDFQFKSGRPIERINMLYKYIFIQSDRSIKIAAIPLKQVVFSRLFANLQKKLLIFDSRKIA